MYCIPLLLVNGKLPVKYVYTFPGSWFAMPIAANIPLLFSSLWGKIYVYISSASCSLFIDLVFFLFDPNVHNFLLMIVAGVNELIIQ